MLHSDLPVYGGVFMAYIIESEEDLASELASRRISAFTDVTRGASNLLFYGPLAAAAILLLIHLAIFSTIYSVQLSRFTGNYAETEATVADYSSHEKKHRHHKKHGRTTTTNETYYSIRAVADDGTEFTYNGQTDYGRKGDKLRIKYSKSNPRNYYVPADLFHMPADRFIGLIMLVLSGLAFYGTYLARKWNRKCQLAEVRDLYLPVRETSRYEVRTVHTRTKSRGRTRSHTHKEYAPIYRYPMPQGPDLLFQGVWSRKKPEGEPANDYTSFRVYMIDPENPNNNKYFIKEFPR
jgi:hypothetical protein